MILIIEDDETLRKGLKELVEGAGYAVSCCRTAEEAEKLCASEKAALCLVDIMLPDGSGIELCKRIRKDGNTPVIFITALDDEETVIRGLSAGADDYVTKPFRAGELLARIEANLRRSSSGVYSIESGGVEYRFPEERVFAGGGELELRPSEQTLLRLFLESRGKLLRRQTLIDAIWESDEAFVEENTLSVLVSRLRKELRRVTGRDHIETVRGVGYRWTAPCSVKGGRS